MQILRDRHIDPDIRLYLVDAPTRSELEDILKKLGIPAMQLVRKSEPIYKDHFKGKVLTEEEWIDAMVQYPKLIERPIVIDGQRAILGRPPENVLELL